MAISETWLLPDGVTDVLPEQAQVIERLRRNLLDHLTHRGFQLIFTPFIEYIDSLNALSESGEDLDLLTFKVIDQVSGRLMGIRADITPQVARIDAHVRPVEGISRYCYTGTVMHTKPQHLKNSRTPLQLGAELFGHNGLDADLEMIKRMLDLLYIAGFKNQLYLDLGHVGLFRSLVDLAKLDKIQEQKLSDIYQRKAFPELKKYTQDLNFGSDFLVLAQYANNLEQLVDNLSAEVLQHPSFSHALQDLQKTVADIEQRWPSITIGIDVVDLRSYHYHTGLNYAVYAPNHANPLAQGGRYDGIGRYFGRSRAATGFSCDLYQLSQHSQPDINLVVAPFGDQADLVKAIEDARQAGWAVTQLYANTSLDSIGNATHQLIKTATQWQIVALANDIKQ